MKIPMSNRLLACCGFVRPGDRVADVGCDHGYLGIYLLQQGLASQVLSSDVREQPLLTAVDNSRRFGVRDRMRFYRCSGVSGLPREYDCVVCAGMGADTILSIISAAPWLRDGQVRLILQCQTRRPYLRRCLSDNGWRILRETLAQDGSFLYPILEAVWEPGEVLTPGQCHISPALLASGSPLLPAFYRRVRGGVEATVEQLKKSSNSEKLAHYQAVLAELLEMEEQIYGTYR